MQPKKITSGNSLRTRSHVSLGTLYSRQSARALRWLRNRRFVPKKFLSLFAYTPQRGINHDMKTDTQKFKAVATFNDRLQAEITAGMLRENGIPAGVFGADSSYPSLGFVCPVEVKVNEEDYDAAVQLLSETSGQ